MMPVKYMAKVATAGGTGDLYTGREQRLDFMSIDGSCDSYKVD